MRVTVLEPRQLQWTCTGGSCVGETLYFEAVVHNQYNVPPDVGSATLYGQQVARDGVWSEGSFVYYPGNQIRRVYFSQEHVCF